MNENEEFQFRARAEREAQAKGSKPQSLGQTMMSAAKNSFAKPAGFAKNLGTNPVTMAQAIPPLAGLAGAVSPLPGGATLGTVGARQISNEALRLLNRKDLIPSGLSQVGEGALAAAGDVMAIPAIKKGIFGRQIGQAERAYPGMASVVKEAPPSGPRTAVKLAQQLKDQDLSPLAAKRFQPAMDAVYQKGIPFQKAFKMYSPDFRDAAAAVQSGLNKIPGRQAPAEAMAKAMTIPNAIRNQVQPIWQNPIIRKLIYAALTGAGIGEGAKLTFGK